MFFRVELFDPSKRATEAVLIDAADARAAAARAREGRDSAVFVLSVSRARAAAGKRRTVRISPRTFDLFCRRLHALLEAGVTVVEAVEVLAVQAEDKRLRSALRDVAASLRAGNSLAAAFATRSDVFPPVFIQTLRSAEETGTAEDAALFLAKHFEREAAFRDKLVQALTYPSLVAALAVIVGLSLAMFVIPRFASILQQGGIPLPLLTRIVVGTAEALRKNFAVVLGGGGALYFTLRSFGFQFPVKDFIVKIPLVGKLVTHADAARVARSLALMTRVGVPLVRALEVVRDSAGSSGFQKELEAARVALNEGKKLSAALEGSRWFNAPMVKMVAVGEVSGRLPEMFEKVGGICEAELDSLMQRLPLYVEVLMLVGVGCLVMLVLLSLFLPIFSVYQTVK